MKHISIIVYENVMCTAVSNTIALLTSANDAALRNHMSALFKIEFIGTERKEVKTNHSIQFQCSKTISDNFKTDVIIIPPYNITSPQQTDVLLAENNPLL